MRLALDLCSASPRLAVHRIRRRINHWPHRHSLSVLAQRSAPQHREHRDIADHLPASRLVSRPLAYAYQIAFDLRRIKHDLMYNARRLMREMHDAARRLAERKNLRCAFGGGGGRAQRSRASQSGDNSFRFVNDAQRPVIGPRRLDLLLRLAVKTVAQFAQRANVTGYGKFN